MKVTKEQIEAARTPAGGWTRKQLELWGVKWPPHKGWKTRLQNGKDPNGRWLSLQDRDKLAKQWIAIIRNDKMDKELRERIDRDKDTP